MSEMTPTPPPGLKGPGMALWDEMQAVFTFDPRETQILISACKRLDVISELEAVAEGVPVMLEGKIHPAVVELRLARGAFEQTLSRLAIPVPAGGAKSTSQMASEMALSRWRKVNRGGA